MQDHNENTNLTMKRKKPQSLHSKAEVEDNSHSGSKLYFQDIWDGDSWAFLIDLSAFSLKCFSRSSRLSSTSLSDSFLESASSSGF